VGGAGVVAGAGRLLALLAVIAAAGGCTKKKIECFEVAARDNSAGTRAAFEARHCQGGGETWSGILEALAVYGHAEKDPLNLAEFVRSQMRRPLTHVLTGGGRDLSVLLLESSIEETIRGAISRSSRSTAPVPIRPPSSPTPTACRSATGS